MKIERVKSLNKRIFKRNLKEKLKDTEAKFLNDEYTFYLWIEDARDYAYITGSFGWFEIPAKYTKSGNPENIRTN